MPVKFEIYAVVNNNPLLIYSVTEYSSSGFLGGRYVTIADLSVVLSDVFIPGQGEVVRHYVTATSGDTSIYKSNTVMFEISSIIDKENSHNIGTYTHQKDYPINQIEVPGDNYISMLDNQGNPVIDPGSASDYKDMI